MLALDLEMTTEHPGIGVIMSPRNYTRTQIEQHARALHSIKAPVLFDPQFYQPRTERENILNYPYWEGLTFGTVDFASTGAATLCKKVIEYQVGVLDVDEVILPGRYTNALTEEWLETQHVFAQTSAGMSLDRPVYATLALGPDIVSNREVFDKLLNEVVTYAVDGLYVILRRPNDGFLVTDDVYLYNLLDGFLSLNLSGKKVILGYANQQSLVFAGAGVSGLASGNFRNVRSFNPQMFDVVETQEMRRATWYYDAGTLSEFRVQALGLAYQRGLSGSFGPVCKHCRPLLESSNPAQVPWGEPKAFRHYLTELNRQWQEIQSKPTHHRISVVKQSLDAATGRLNSLISRGLRPGERSFASAFEPTLGALTAFSTDRYRDLQTLR